MKFLPLLLSLAFLGCGISEHHSAVSTSGPSPGHAYILSDRHDATFEYVYCYDGQSIVAQKHIFPGYTDRKSFVCSSLPADLHFTLRMWIRHKGEITPPFEPGGPWYSITLFSEGQRERTTWFRDSNADLRQLFDQLQKHCMVDANRAASLPETLQANSEIMKFYGH